MIDEIIKFLKQLTWKKLSITAAAVILAIILITIYENRQDLFETTKIAPTIHGDWPLRKPVNGGEKLLSSLTKRYPEISLVVVVDADPVKNQRIVVHREYNNTELKATLAEQAAKGQDATASPLFTSNAEENQLILNIMLGEFQCAPSEGTGIARMYDGLEKLIVVSCRVPLPPAYLKVTGWISVHFTAWPIRDYDRFRQDALNTALEYYELEVNKKH